MENTDILVHLILVFDNIETSFWCYLKNYLFFLKIVFSNQNRTKKFQNSNQNIYFVSKKAIILHVLFWLMKIFYHENIDNRKDINIWILCICVEELKVDQNRIYKIGLLNLSYCIYAQVARPDVECESSLWS